VQITAKYNPDVNHTTSLTYVKISSCENVPRVWTPANVNQTRRTLIYFARPLRLFQWPNLWHTMMVQWWQDRSVNCTRLR